MCFCIEPMHWSTTNAALLQRIYSFPRFRTVVFCFGVILHFLHSIVYLLLVSISHICKHKHLERSIVYQMNCMHANGPYIHTHETKKNNEKTQKRIIYIREKTTAWCEYRSFSLQLQSFITFSFVQLFLSAAALWLQCRAQLAPVQTQTEPCEMWYW